MEQPLRWATVHSSCECPGWLLSRWIFPTRETSFLSLGCLACFGVLCTYDKYVEIIRSLLQSALWSSCFLPVQKSDRAPRLGKFKQSISEKALQPIIFEMNERYQFFTFFFFLLIFFGLADQGIAQMSLHLVLTSPRLSIVMHGNCYMYRNKSENYVFFWKERRKGVLGEQERCKHSTQEPNGWAN